jgi:NADPH2:quinone reductase
VKAVALHSFGPPDVLTVVDLAEPRSRLGHVVVAVAAATVNPTDALLRSGGQAEAMKGLLPPYIPGMELAGRIVETGDQSRFSPGQLVMAPINPRRPEGGAQAERVLVPTDSLLPVPDGMGLVEAATLPMNGLTAVKAMEALDLEAGDILMVTGGAGALGGYVVQMAHHAGIRVIADAKSQDVHLLRGLGADVVVPRGEGMFSAVRDVAPEGVDGLVDAGLVGAAAHALVRDAGTSVAVRGVAVDADPRVRHHAVSVGKDVEDRDALRELADLVERRVLVPRVALTLSYERAADAHRALERGGLRGRIVLTFDS